MSNPASILVEQSQMYQLDNLDTNLGRWRYFMANCTSPNDYINFGFYFIIAASLQRRVWLGGELRPLYPNIYPIFVGAAGIGKGLVLTQIDKVLRHWPWENPRTIQASMAAIKADKAPVEAVDFKALAQVYAEAQAVAMPEDKKEVRRKLLFPMGADTTTFEKLIEKMAESTRYIPIKKILPSGKEVDGVYSYACLSMLLEEMGMLFRKKTEDIATLLQKAYDCGDIDYEVKSAGKSSYVKNCCLNFCAGTTPDFMQQVFDDAILNQGISSRAWFLYAHSNRFSKMFIAEETADQLAARDHILQHIKKLSTVYGKASFSEDAQTFLVNWWEIEMHSGKRPNKSEKLNHYYARKNIHIQKMAMLIHFADAKFDANGKCSMMIELESVMRAFELLDPAEMKMHLALQLRGQNTLAAPSTKVLKYIKSSAMSVAYNELLVEFWTETGEGELRDILNYLKRTEKIAQLGDDTYVALAESITTETKERKQTDEQYNKTTV